ncbi:MAG: DNA polymerase III subunit delta' [Parcubacteria group bacterium Gr01-1014_8]|nr:MAG: DNA polymerase III subunit delta' [Parcubacteria group bacterium Gr01-1014_8]
MEKKSAELVSAYLVAGGAEKITAIEEFLLNAGFDTKGSPDVYIREYLNFGIDDARALRDRANMRAVQSSRRVFILIAPSMTHDAQNALLKTLEEPPADCVFFFVVAAPAALLSTLRSRGEMLVLEGSADERLIEPGAFLIATPESRLEMLKPLYAKTDDDERDVRKAVRFLQDLEYALANEKRGEVKEGLHAVYRARKYLMDKGALLKPLLEQVALLTPQV